MRWNILRARMMDPRATHHIAEVIELTEQLIRPRSRLCGGQRRRDVRRPDRSNYGVLSRQDPTSCRQARAVDVVDDKLHSQWTSFCGRCRKRANQLARLRGAHGSSWLAH